MTQEEKQLLTNDLCARLPYGIFIHTWYNKPLDIKCTGIDLYTNTINLDIPDDDNAKVYIDNCKLYLRPLSSMTEEERKEFIYYASYDIEESVNGRHYEYYLKDGVGTPEEPTCNYDAIDWLNAHHFDYRGLIEKGLAIEAPEVIYGIFH